MKRKREAEILVELLGIHRQLHQEVDPDQTDGTRQPRNEGHGGEGVGKGGSGRGAAHHHEWGRIVRDYGENS